MLYSEKLKCIFSVNTHTHLECTYTHLLNTLSAYYILFTLLNAETQCQENYYPHFTVEKPEAQGC